ncbi:recombinase family protein [Pseudarthrobacter oxydans]|uniref:recombinase family protein n=1 Tax=Pseudarthrobacter oxydans TaxID=1671 RepID=UPI0034441E14
MTATAVYVRQSEDKTGQEAAVQRQQKDCSLLAQAKGWESPVIYADNSISATNGKTRPQFELLLAEIEAGRIGRLVVWHLDRLTRSMRDLTRVIEAGRAHRVNIACVHGVSLDLGDPTGVAVAQILTAIAGMETSHKGQRQKTANKQRAAEGKAFWTRRPFGYDREKTGSGYRVFVVEQEAEAIRAAAADVLAGKTLSAIVREWKAAGLRTTDVRQDKATGEVTKDGGQWGVTQLRRLLLNPRYIGKRMYNGDEMELAGDWDPILEPEVFEQLEIVLNDPKRRTAPDDLNAKYLLSGIAQCGKCGKPMYAAPYRNKGKTLMVYRCFGGYCLQRSMDAVDDVVDALVITYLSRPDAAKLFSGNGNAAELRAKSADLRDRRDALAAMLAEGLMSVAAVREQSSKLSQELSRVEDALRAAESLNPVSAVAGAPDVPGAWQALPLASRKQIIRALMSVTILPAGKGTRFSPEHLRIDWN